jgi:hypothetical protein
MSPKSRTESDEAYVVDLCDVILGEPALRQHLFDWLLSDPGRNDKRRRLQVDAYYPGHRLVIEYQERQHDEPIPHFDKPGKLTVSGVHRGIQRRIYDERRVSEIPAHGLRLVIVKPADLAANQRGRLQRHRDNDLPALRALLDVDSVPQRSPKYL